MFFIGSVKEEGPPIQLGNRGYPSEWRQVSEMSTLLEVLKRVEWFNVQVICYSSSVGLLCLFVVKEMLTICLEGKSDCFTLVGTKCNVDQ